MMLCLNCRVCMWDGDALSYILYIRLVVIVVINLIFQKFSLEIFVRASQLLQKNEKCKRCFPGTAFLQYACVFCVTWNRFPFLCQTKCFSCGRVCGLLLLIFCFFAQTFNFSLSQDILHMSECSSSVSVLCIMMMGNDLFYTFSYEKCKRNKAEKILGRLLLDK